MPVSNATEMWAELRFELKALDPALNIGYALYDDENRLLYWSNHNDQAEAALAGFTARLEYPAWTNPCQSAQ